MAGRRVQLPVVRQHPHQHDGAGHDDRQAEDEAAGQAQPSAWAPAAPSRVATALAEGAGNGHATHGEQVFEMELEADAEHEQDDADLGELLGEYSDRRRTRECAGRPAMPASR